MNKNINDLTNKNLLKNNTKNLNNLKDDKNYTTIAPNPLIQIQLQDLYREEAALQRKLMKLLSLVPRTMDIELRIKQVKYQILAVQQKIRELLEKEFPDQKFPRVYPNQLPGYVPEFPNIHPDMFPKKYPDMFPEKHPNEFPRKYPDEFPELNPKVAPDRIYPEEVPVPYTDPYNPFEPQM